VDRDSPLEEEVVMLSSLGPRDTATTRVRRRVGPVRLPIRHACFEKECPQLIIPFFTLLLFILRAKTFAFIGLLCKNLFPKTVTDFTHYLVAGGNIK
jgi:hypothetical protein